MRVDSSQFDLNHLYISTLAFDVASEAKPILYSSMHSSTPRCQCVCVLPFRRKTWTQRLKMPCGL